MNVVILVLGKTYPLESGLQAESGRLTHFAQDKGNECGVIISDIQVLTGANTHTYMNNTHTIINS